MTKLIELHSVWTVKDDKDPNVTHTVDVVIDWERLQREVRFVAVRAARAKGWRVGFNHRMIVGTRRKP